MKNTLILLYIALLFHACVGVDYIDDRNAIVERDLSRIDLDEDNLVLFLDMKETISAHYFDQQGDPKEVMFNYTSASPAIATVNSTGEVTAVSEGQTSIKVAYESSEAEVLISVISDSNAIARIELNTDKVDLKIGEEFQFIATAYNFLGTDITSQVQFEWLVDNASIASVDNTGKVTATTDGETVVWAKVGSFRSTPATISIGGDERSGSFSGLSGYSVSGDVTVRKKNDTEITISFGPNFTAQNGPGLAVFLSNQQNSIAAGKEVGALISNTGEQTYTVAGDIFDYNFVLVHCKPFNVPFGTASLQ